MLKRISMVSGVSLALTFSAPVWADGATPINFLPGTTFYAFTTTLTHGIPQSYVLSVSAQQIMYITQNGNARISVLDPQGNAVVENTTMPESGVTFVSTSEPEPWKASANQTGDYTLVLDGDGVTTVSVYIPPLGAATSPSVPLPSALQPIHFAPGDTSYAFTTYLYQGAAQGYQLNIRAQQQVSITANGNTTIGLLDPSLGDVQAVASPLTTLPQATLWQYTVPQTGDYTLVLMGTGPVTVSIYIPPFLALPSPSAQRISFAPGATTAIVTPNLTAGSPQSYVLEIQAGQTLHVSTSGIVIVTVFDAQHNALSSSANPYGEMLFNIPQTGDYTVTLTGNGPVQMTVYIPPL